MKKVIREALNMQGKERRRKHARLEVGTAQRCDLGETRQLKKECVCSEVGLLTLPRG